MFSKVFYLEELYNIFYLKFLSLFLEDFSFVYSLISVNCFLPLAKPPSRRAEAELNINLGQYDI